MPRPAHWPNRRRALGYRAPLAARDEALPTIDLGTIRARLRALANPRIAAHSQRFFKTVPGEYGHRDRFLGIRVPMLRTVAREARTAPLPAVLALLRSPYHEERLVALLMLVDRHARGDAALRERLYAHYLAHVPEHVNNWDLVDCSAHLIVGAHLEQRDRGVLYDLARSPHLWSRRDPGDLLVHPPRCVRRHAGGR
jgi:3-methyladenine DNA glycosylase AlkD